MRVSRRMRCFATGRHPERQRGTWKGGRRAAPAPRSLADARDDVGAAVILLLLVLAAFPLRAATVDRVAATIDQQVLTVSEINQMVSVRFFPRTAGQSDDDFRREILEALIAQAPKRST